MIITTTESPNGLGRMTIRPETDEERIDFERVCPKKDLPGIVHGYEWQGDNVVLFAQADPTYQAPVTPPKENAFAPVPKATSLAEWKMADLVTRAAELSVKHDPGETKAALIAKIIPAWEKANRELAAKGAA